MFVYDSKVIGVFLVLLGTIMFFVFSVVLFGLTSSLISLGIVLSLIAVVRGSIMLFDK